MSANPSTYGLERPYSVDDPFDMDDARRASHTLATRRRAIEEEYGTAQENAADADRAYKKAWAIEYLKAEGPVAEREAHADERTIDKRFASKAADGLVKALDKRLQGLEGERAMLRMLCDWSRDILGAGSGG